MTDLTFVAIRTRSVARAIPGDVLRVGAQLLDAGRTRLLADPPLPVLTLLRRCRPVLRLRTLTMYTAAAQVARVLGDDVAFRVTPYAGAARDLLGEFALGVDGARHALLRTELDERLAPLAAGLQPWADDAACRILAEATAAWVADPVAELGWRLPTAFVADRGLCPSPARDGDEDAQEEEWDEGHDELCRQATDVYEACFANLRRDRGVAGRGRRASAALAARGLTTQDIGLVVGAIPTVCEAVTRAVPVLRADPTRWAHVRQAAARDDHTLLWAYVAEALRFDPQAPGLVRAPADDPERLVFASTYAAMHDPTRVARPAAFRTDRPEHTYLHFGLGPHRCPGEQIATTLLTAAVRAVALADLDA